MRKLRSRSELKSHTHVGRSVLLEGRKHNTSLEDSFLFKKEEVTHMSEDPFFFKKKEDTKHIVFLPCMMIGFQTSFSQGVRFK